MKYVQKNLCIFLFTPFISLTFCFTIRKSVIEEHELLNSPILDSWIQKLDSIIETFNGQSSKIGICTKEVENMTYPKSCADLRLAGATCDGTYVIYPRALGPVTVRCDMTTGGGGWTILLRRGNYGEKRTSFIRNWDDYKNGFGDTEGELWLGNEVIHHITTGENNTELQIRLDTDYDTSYRDKYAALFYSHFTVGNQSSGYSLNYLPISFSEDYFRDLLPIRSPFRTYDANNEYLEGRFNSLTVGWWGQCERYCLTSENRIYVKYGTVEYINGNRPTSRIISVNVKEALMMIRPENFTITV